jgi:hypothetical protein
MCNIVYKSILFCNLYVTLYWKNSCRLYTYSGKFPSLNWLYSGYGGKFLQVHLYIKLRVGTFSPRALPATDVPPRMSSLLHQKLDKGIWFFSMWYQEVDPSLRGPTPSAPWWYPPCCSGPCPLTANMLKHFLLSKKVFVPTLSSLANPKFKRIYNYIINLLN